MKSCIFVILALLSLSGPVFAAGCPDVDRSACAPKLSDKQVADIRQKAQKGDASAQFALGDIYAFGDGAVQSWGDALTWYMKAAQQGDARAQFETGLIYDEGRGLDADCDKALSWFQKSAAQNYPPAQEFEGHMFMAGRCVKQDSKTGVHLLEESAAQGNIGARSMLCDAYYSGVGIKRDYAVAEFWCMIMAEGHDASGAFWREETDKHLSAQDKATADRLAAEWLKAHAHPTSK